MSKQRSLTMHERAKSFAQTLKEQQAIARMKQESRSILDTEPNVILTTNPSQHGVPRNNGSIWMVKTKTKTSDFALVPEMEEGSRTRRATVGGMNLSVMPGVSGKGVSILIQENSNDGADLNSLHAVADRSRSYSVAGVLSSTVGKVRETIVSKMLRSKPTKANNANSQRHLA